MLQTAALLLHCPALPALTLAGAPGAPGTGKVLLRGGTP